MKPRQRLAPKYLLLAPWFSLVVFCFGVLGYFKLTTNVRREEPDNNPDKFHLWTTNSSYGYTFTYDPHAADAWLFRTGVPKNTNRLR
jgi:hypothetical protein